MDINLSLLSENANILVVDDTVENLSLLTRMLKDCGYTARPVPNGRLAIQAARGKKPDLILLDINMPEMNGYEVCRQLKSDAYLKEVPVLFISALSEINEKVKAFEVGAVDYITKPFQFEEVHMRVETHLRLHQLQVNLSDQVASQVKEITELQMAMLFGFAKLAEARDSDTGKHLDRIRILCKLLAENVLGHPKFGSKVNQAYCDLLYHASPLHDIGKVGIVDEILLKPGPLTPDEFEVMKTHTLIGSQTLEEIQQRFHYSEFLNMGVHIARSHHEKWNGTGYPDGLSHDEIPLAARIMAIVDVYDAMRSKRVYKPPFSHEETCAAIRKGSGSHFDPDLAEVFIGLEDAFDEVWNKMKD